MKKRILIVDDDDGILEALRAVLEFEGFEVMTLDNPETIFTTIDTFVPEVILIDYLLSGKEGTVFVKELKADQRYCLIPVIMMSAHPLALETAKKSGADIFIHKPFEIDTLVSLIKKTGSI